MTKAELLEMLEELPDNAEITLALQPNYPMTGSIRNICIKRRDGEAVGAVIACSGHEAYGSSIYWNEYDIEVDEKGNPIDDED